jgi:hypothetical protein
VKKREKGMGIMRKDRKMGREMKRKRETKLSKR